jgi:hypothetical protein
VEEFVVMAAVKFISGSSLHTGQAVIIKRNFAGVTVSLCVLSNRRPRFLRVKWMCHGNRRQSDSDKDNGSQQDVLVAPERAVFSEKYLG